MPVLEARHYYQPILQLLRDHPGGLDGELLVERAAALAGLSEEDRLAPPTGSPKYVERVRKARLRLEDDGMVRRRRDGRWAITERGTAKLSELVARWSLPPEDEEADDNDEGAPSPAQPPRMTALPDLPTDQLDRLLRQIRADVEADLRERFLRCSPAFFEQTALRLLSAMGYGAPRHTGRPGDDGIDGFLRSDPLGLHDVFVQAKRRQPDQCIDPDDIRGFEGALAKRGGARGVFVTNARFATEAWDDKLRPRIVGGKLRLIDGKELTALLIEHGVGVSRAEVRVIPEVDRYFFDDD